jgi:hypothetical protein
MSSSEQELGRGFGICWLPATDSEHQTACQVAGRAVGRTGLRFLRKWEYPRPHKYPPDLDWGITSLLTL